MVLQEEGDNLDGRNIELLWYTFINVIGIEDLDRMPFINSESKNNQDTMATMYIYSMESFLYKRINQVSRNKNCPSVKNLGPYAVLISRIIEQRSSCC